MLVVVAVAIRIFAADHGAVEKYYSNGIYPYISIVQRVLFGWVPFSVGDLLYTAAGLWLIYQLIAMLRSVVNKRAPLSYWKNAGIKLIRVLLIIYIVFKLLWGLNYNRRGIDYQLKLDSLNYTNEDLIAVSRLLAQKINALQPASEANRVLLKRKRTLFRGAINAYEELAANGDHFKYAHPSIKPSIFSYMGNYLGFTGYYNPFTGEAQVNTTVPVFVRPFTSCHEIGHQLGYAKESEANFAAYLSAAASRDSAFLYSVYFEMFAYASRYLYYADSSSLKQLNEELSPAVKKDFREIREFYRRYETPLEAAIDRIYSNYLKANEQPSGRMSYNEVVAMLIAYYRQHGKV